MKYLPRRNVGFDTRERLRLFFDTLGLDEAERNPAWNEDFLFLVVMGDGSKQPSPTPSLHRRFRKASSFSRLPISKFPHSVHSYTNLAQS